MKDDEFRSNLYHNTTRYLTHLYAAADRLMPPPTRDLNPTDFADAYAIYQDARQKRMDEAKALARQNGATTDDEKSMFPPELMRRYQIVIVPETNSKPAQLRAIKAKDVSRDAHTTAVACVRQGPLMISVSY